MIAVLVQAVFAFSFDQFPTVTGQADPTVIAVGADGNLWFTETLANRIGRITPSGSITEFPLPTQSALPSGITSGPDGNLWFTEPGSAKIGRITPSGVISEFAIRTTTSNMFSAISAGPDGALWFTDAASNSIGRITTDGAAKEFAIPTKGANPFGITAGTDGGIWFTEPGANQIGRISPDAGTFSEFRLPTEVSNPGFITAGPDGAVWFTEFNASKIGRIDASGAITEFPLPAMKSGPDGITSGPDGALWFTENSTGKIGQLVMTTPPAIRSSANLTPADVTFNEFQILAATNPGPTGIATGPDHNLWFAEGNISSIGRLTPDVQPATADLSIAVTPPSGSVSSGAQTSYAITVSNNSAQQTATGVTVNAPTPEGTTFSSVSASGAQVSPPSPGSTGTIDAMLGSLGPGATASLQVTVNVLAVSGTNLNLTATVSGTSIDPNPANNTARGTIPVQGGGIVFLSWTRPVSTASSPVPPPGNLTASAEMPIQMPTSDLEFEQSDTGCAITGYNIYLPASAATPISSGNLWAVVPPGNLNAKVASIEPAGSFYIVTTLWNCDGTIMESIPSNTASVCAGPPLSRAVLGHKIKLFGSGFTDPATGAVNSIFIDGFPFNRPPVFARSTLLKQKGKVFVNMNGTTTAMKIPAYVNGKASVSISVQVETMQGDTCISTIAVSP